MPKVASGGPCIGGGCATYSGPRGAGYLITTLYSTMA